MFSLLYTGFSACDAAERAGRMALQLCTFPFTLKILVRELFLGSVQTKPQFFFFFLAPSAGPFLVLSFSKAGCFSELHLLKPMNHISTYFWYPTFANGF